MSSLQAFGAVAPIRKNSQKRLTMVIAAAAMAMAITALVLLASGSGSVRAPSQKPIPRCMRMRFGAASPLGIVRLGLCALACDVSKCA